MFDARRTRGTVHTGDRQALVLETLGDRRAFITYQPFQFFQRDQIGIVVQTQQGLAVIGEGNAAYAALTFSKSSWLLDHELWKTDGCWSSLQQS